MTMPGARDRVSTVKIEILVALARIDPNTLAMFCGDRHLLVRSELKLVFVRHHQNPRHPRYGFVPTNSRPVFSSRPNIKFMFCTAWPAAPLTRLSIAEKITICLPR